jgi:hypothetical protein
MAGLWPLNQVVDSEVSLPPGLLIPSRVMLAPWLVDRVTSRAETMATHSMALAYFMFLGIGGYTQGSLISRTLPKQDYPERL